MAKYVGRGQDLCEKRVGADAYRNAPAVRDGEMRASLMQVRDKARLGVGIDGMPLRPGQTGPTLQVPEDPIEAELDRLCALRYRMIGEHRSGAEIMQICDRIRELKEARENAGASDV